MEQNLLLLKIKNLHEVNDLCWTSAGSSHWKGTLQSPLFGCFSFHNFLKLASCFMIYNKYLFFIKNIYIFYIFLYKYRIYIKIKLIYFNFHSIIFCYQVQMMFYVSQKYGGLFCGTVMDGEGISLKLYKPRVYNFIHANKSRDKTPHLSLDTVQHLTFDPKSSIPVPCLWSIKLLTHRSIA